MVPTRQIEKRSPSASVLMKTCRACVWTVGMKRTCRLVRRLNMVSFSNERLLLSLMVVGLNTCRAAVQVSPSSPQALSAMGARFQKEGSAPRA